MISECVFLCSDNLKQRDVSMSDNKFLRKVDGAMAPVYGVVLSIWGLFILLGIVALGPIHWFVIAEAAREPNPNNAGVIIMVFVDIILTCIVCALTKTKKLMPCAWVVSIFICITCIVVMGWIGVLIGVIFLVGTIAGVYRIKQMIEGTLVTPQKKSWHPIAITISVIVTIVVIIIACILEYYR